MKKRLIEELTNLGYDCATMELKELKNIAESLGIIHDGLFVKTKPNPIIPEGLPHRPEGLPSTPAGLPEIEPSETIPSPTPDKPKKDSPLEPIPEPEKRELPELEPAETIPSPTPDKPEPEPTAKDDFADLQARIRNAKTINEAGGKKTPFIEVTKTRKKKGESSPDSFRVEGYMMLMVADTVFPNLFALINNFLDKNIKIKATELILSEYQTKKLEPLADQAADYLKIKINPVIGFVILSSIMYGTNLVTLKETKKMRLI